MNVAIVNLTAGGFSGGYRKYLLSLLPLLHRHRDVERLEVFIPHQAVGRLGEISSVLQRVTTLGFFQSQRDLRGKLRRLDADVVFIPTARWLDCGSTPVVTMIRNMEPLVVPCEGHTFVGCIQNFGRAVLARRACQRSMRIIAVSRYVRDFLVSRWGLSPDRVGIVAHGTEAPLQVDESARPCAVPAALTRKSFLFTAGSIRPARGLEDVISALASLRSDMDPPCVVIAGEHDPGSQAYHRHLTRFSERLGVAPSLIWAGRLGSPQMAWCYSRCAAFVMTSRTEACPNTLLEAMSHGCLIISTDQPPMPEFLQGAAHYYRARDALSLQRQLRGLLMETQAEGERTQAGLVMELARKYTWQAAADATIAELLIARQQTHRRSI